MRVALHQAAVHEGARVSLVSVADDVFLGPRLLKRQAPLPPRGEATATPAAQSRESDLLADRFRRHSGEGRLRGAVASVVDVLADILGIQGATRLEHIAVLERVEGDLAGAAAMLAAQWIRVEQAIHDLAALQGGLNDLRYILGANPRVEDPVRLDRDKRTLLTEPLAAALREANIAALILGAQLCRDRQAGGGDLLHERRVNLQRPIGDAPRARADHHPALVGARYLPVLPGHSIQIGPGRRLHRLGNAHRDSSLARISSITSTAASGVI